MVYTVLAGVIIVLAFGVVLLAARMLLKSGWILGWLKGMSGIVLVAVAVIMVFSALDFFTYKQLKSEESVANLSFTEISPQTYKVSLVDSNGQEQIKELKGDLWQLDTRVLKWNTFVAQLGLAPGYRLDRLSGRYYSLEEEQNSPRTVHQLIEKKSIIDIWSWLRSNGQRFNLLDASYGSATYLPMADGALYAVTLSNTGLLARPLNESAKTAVEQWP